MPVLWWPSTAMNLMERMGRARVAAGREDKSAPIHVGMVNDRAPTIAI